MLPDNIRIVYFLDIFLHLGLIKGESITNVGNVLNDVFSPAVYNKDIRGKLDQTQAMDINLSFALKNIKTLDEVEETIEAFGVLFLAWKDERLIWDPSAYNGTDKVHTTADKIWRPEIALENPSTSHSFFGDVVRLLSLHKSNGEVSLIIGDIFKCSCSIDLTSYPWDKQKCAIDIVVWGYSVKEVKLVPDHETINLQRYQSNRVWTLLSTKVYSKPHPQKSLLAFEVVLQRRPLFFVVNVLLPIVTLSVLELFVFIVPIDSGERISFSLTVLLSIAVCITLISDNLPPGAETMASICYLLLFILIQSALICLFNIVSVKLYTRHVENNGINTFWFKFVDIFGKAKWCLRQGKVDIKTDIYNKEVDGGNGGNVNNADAFEIMKKISISWKDVSKTFDRVVSILMTFLLCFTFSMYAYSVSTGV